MASTEDVAAVATIDDATVLRVLTPQACRAVLREALTAYARGDASNPVRTVIETESGWFATMPAAVRGAGAMLGAKLVTVFPGNAALGEPTHRALVVLFDAYSGAPRALVAADAITARRTAAVSVLAAERFAPAEAQSLAILGAGVQGRAHVEAFAAARPIARLAVWSRTAERAAELCAYANGLGLQARRAHDPHDALRDADLIVTATAAAEPLFAAGAVRPGAFVAAVGACVPTRRELPAALIAAAVFVADDAAAARREAGDLLIAERELGRELPIAGTLGEFLAEPTREAGHAGATIVFESLGLGLEDVACAHYVVENAVGKEMGAARRP